jgi:hypothetical protein
MERAEMKRRRDILLQRLGDTVWSAAYNDDAFHGRERMELGTMRRVAGPRAGTLLVDGGRASARLYDALSKSKALPARAMYPAEWLDERGEVEVAVRGRWVSLSAPWPEHLQTRVVKLSELSQHPGDGRAMTMGVSERGHVIVLHLNDRTSNHILIGGMTGSGKTNALRLALAQLTQGDDNRFILLDGKGSRDSLAALNGIPGQIGPVAVESRDIRNALGWAWLAMRKRNAGIDSADEHLFVFFDEFHDYTANDPLVARLVKLLASQGRSAGVHLVFATQSPKKSMFGDSGTRPMFGVRVGLLVSDRYESEAIMFGTEPRLDHLTGSGDSQIETKERIRHRALLAFVSEREAQRIGGGEPQMHRWPTFDASLLDGADRKPGPEPEKFTVHESLVGMWAAEHGHGREKIITTLRERLGYGMGSDRVDNGLIPRGEELLEFYRRLGSD